MKALTYYGRGETGRGDFRIEDVPEPAVVPGTVKIDVEWCGICGSDLHEFEADTISGYSPPVILGHEFAGTVSAVGDGVDHVRVGQRVAIEPFMYCQTCEFCVTGDYHVCRDLSVVGVHTFGGGFAEETWRGMQSEQLANQIAQSGGLGIAESLMGDLIAMQEAAQASASSSFMGQSR